MTTPAPLDLRYGFQACVPGGTDAPPVPGIGVASP